FKEDRKAKHSLCLLVFVCIGFQVPVFILVFGRVCICVLLSLSVFLLLSVCVCVCVCVRCWGISLELPYSLEHCFRRTHFLLHALAMSGTHAGRIPLK